MCVLAVFDQPTHEIRRIVLHNRDEFYSRAFESGSIHRVGDRLVFHGVDLEAGGAWLTVSATLFAAVLNLRLPPPSDPLPNYRSRGELPLLAQTDPIALLRRLQDPQVAQSYRPFNLLLSTPTGLLSQISSTHSSIDRETAPSPATRASSRTQHPFTLTNHDRPAERWFKEERLAGNFGSVVRPETSIEEALRLAHHALEDRTLTDRDVPPYTGLPSDTERELSSIFVSAPARAYGTVLSTVVTYLATGSVLISEKNHRNGQTALWTLEPSQTTNSG